MDQKPGNSSESFFKKITYTDGIYPALTIVKNDNSNRLYAIPLIGFLAKVLLLIPVAIFMLFLTLWLFVVAIVINPFVVLFTGKYWSLAYQFAISYLRYSVKISMYLYGLTDRYPGFNFQTPPGLTVDIPMPENPRRFFAIPLIGLLVRVIFLIPYYIFLNVINNAVAIGVFLLAWAVVLFKGKYPDGIFELARDSVRANISAYAYILGLSDRYPSFYISMAHDKIKIILIVLAILFGGWNYSQDTSERIDQELDFKNYQIEDRMSPSMQNYESYQEQSLQEN